MGLIKEHTVCIRYLRLYRCVIVERMVAVMFFGKSNKDVRLTDSQYKNLVGNMSKKERREFDRNQKKLQRDRDDYLILGMLLLNDELDDM